MSFPGFVIPYLIGIMILPGGALALAAKAAIYCLFQQALSKGKAIGLAIVIHLLSSTLGIALSCLLLPDQGYGWKTYAGVYFLYAAAVSMAIEFVLLFPLRKRLTLRRLATNVLVANAVYYVGLMAGVFVFSGIQGLARIE